MKYTPKAVWLPVLHAGALPKPQYRKRSSIEPESVLFDDRHLRVGVCAIGLPLAGPLLLLT
jgi:phenylpropionate dioxygenase-like ring-hydroxylating dioxygenase large terminal subunit